MNKRNILRILGVMVILWGAGVYAMNNRSMAACGPQTGFALVLQKAFFGPSSNGCTYTTSGPTAGTCTSIGGTCSLSTTLSRSVNGSGICQQAYSGANKVGCVCVAGQ